MPIYKPLYDFLSEATTLDELLEKYSEWYGSETKRLPIGIMDLELIFAIIGDLNAVAGSYLNGASFNTSNGEITMTVLGQPNVVVDIDGRYIPDAPIDGSPYVRKDGSWIVSGAGVSDFVNLTDTPGTIAADQYLKGNSGGTALEFLTLATLQTNVNYWTKTGNNITYNTAGGVVTAGIKRVTHVIGGANFYSGGGDDGGAFTGDYDIVIGEEAYDGATWPNTGSPYHVNVGLGYGALKDSTNLDYIVAIGGGAGRNTDADLTPPVGSYASGQGGGVMIGASAGRDIPNYNLSVLIGGDSGRNVNTIFRATLVGNKTGYHASAGSVELYKATVVGSFAAYETGGLEHVVLMGHEAGLTSSAHTLANVIGIGDYAFKDGSADTVITIGNFRVRGGGASNWTGSDNTINIGHFVQGSQAYTINWPTDYYMGIGTQAPTGKLEIKGENDLISDFGLVVTDQSGNKILVVRNDGEVLLPQLTSQGTIGTDVNGVIVTGSGGASTFDALTDTPGAKAGAGGYLVRVNAGASLLEYVDGATLFASASHVHALNDLTDVNDAGKSTGSLIRYDGANWTVYDDSNYASSSHNHTLDSLSNVTITANSSGEILKWDGAAWINNTLAEAGIAATSHNHTVDSLSNVTITSNSSGEVLSWNGSAWINQTLAELGIMTALINIKEVSTTTYTLVAGDLNYLIRFTNASGCTVTLPNSLSTGFQCVLSNDSAGTVTLSATTTLNAEGTKLVTQYTAASVTHIGSNVWRAYGKLTV